MEATRSNKDGRDYFGRTGDGADGKSGSGSCSAVEGFEIIGSSALYAGGVGYQKLSGRDTSHCTFEELSRDVSDMVEKQQDCILIDVINRIDRWLELYDYVDDKECPREIKKAYDFLSLAFVGQNDKKALINLGGQIEALLKRSNEKTITTSSASYASSDNEDDDVRDDQVQEKRYEKQNVEGNQSSMQNELAGREERPEGEIDSRIKYLINDIEELKVARQECVDPQEVKAFRVILSDRKKRLVFLRQEKEGLQNKARPVETKDNDGSKEVVPQSWGVENEQKKISSVSPVKEGDALETNDFECEPTSIPSRHLPNKAQTRGCTMAEASALVNHQFGLNPSARDLQQPDTSQNCEDRENDCEVGLDAVMEHIREHVGYENEDASRFLSVANDAYASGLINAAQYDAVGERTNKARAGLGRQPISWQMKAAPYVNPEPQQTNEGSDIYGPRTMAMHAVAPDGGMENAEIFRRKLGEYRKVMPLSNEDAEEVMERASKVIGDTCMNDEFEDVAAEQRFLVADLKTIIATSTSGEEQIRANKMLQSILNATGEEQQLRPSQKKPSQQLVDAYLPPCEGQQYDSLFAVNEFGDGDEVAFRLEQAEAYRLTKTEARREGEMYPDLAGVL